jgi:hypothetical protein
VYATALQADEVLGISSSIHEPGEFMALDDNLMRVVSE